jgi:hypothetical protein
MTKPAIPLTPLRNQISVGGRQRANDEAGALKLTVETPFFAHELVVEEVV